MRSPFFSVLMPVFNAGRYVGRAVRDVLGQRERDWELVVVDDGSTDATPSVLAGFRDHRVRVIRNERNLGLVETLNRGLAECRGLWVARQDADDRAHPARLSAQRAMIESNPSFVLFHSQARLIGPGGLWRGDHRVPCGDAELRWDLCFRNGVIHTSAVFPRKRVLAMGGYAGDNVVADYDLWSRLLREGRACGLLQTLVSYRIHATSIMAAENARPERQAGVAGIMGDNLREWAGATDQEIQDIVEGWLRPGPTKVAAFVAASESLRGRKLAPPRAVLAALDYTLFHRAAACGCGTEFLEALRKGAPGRRRALPTLRIAVSRWFIR